MGSIEVLSSLNVSLLQFVCRRIILLELLLFLFHCLNIYLVVIIWHCDPLSRWRISLRVLLDVLIGSIKNSSGLYLKISEKNEFTFDIGLDWTRC